MSTQAASALEAPSESGRGRVTGVPKRTLIFFGGLVCLTTACTTIRPARQDADWSQGPGKQVFERVLLVVLENQDYEDVMEDQYFSKDLAEQGTLFRNFHAIRHPSYPNYIALVAGTTDSIFGDSQLDLGEASVADLLKAKHKTWKNYAEGYPGDPDYCFTKPEARRYSYVRKHVPFLSFKSIQQDPDKCANVVDPLKVVGPTKDDTKFAVDIKLSRFPNFAFYSPDMCHSGHGYFAPKRCGFTTQDEPVERLKHARNWLRSFLNPLLADTNFMKGTLIIVTFDESKLPDHHGNHIYTLFVGPMVKRNHKEDTETNHYNVLRTIEENFGLGTLGKQDALNGPITTIWE